MIFKTRQTSSTSKHMNKWLFILLTLFAFTKSHAQPVGYYNNVEGKSGDELKTILNELIDNHVDFSYSFTKNIINYADADPDNPDNVILFYLQESRDASQYGTGGDNINREHVWAKSHGTFSGIRPMDSDAHNLHPADASVNEDRGNKDFDNIQPKGSQHPEAIYCYFTDSTWEPGPATKGQVARTLFYMATRYEGTNEEMDLELARYNNTYPKPLHGNLDALLEWNRQYPPSELERRRNERVYESQQNRNPFVDHPEFADFIWGEKTPTGIQFSNFQITPQFPKPSEAINLAITAEGAPSINELQLTWGASYRSNDNQATMQGNGNSYSTEITPAGMQAGDWLHVTARAVTADSTYLWTASYRYPETTPLETITSIPDVQGTGDQSPQTGQTVTIAGRVTANFDYAFYLQTNEASHAGINVYNTLYRGQVGDSLTVRGTIDEYNQLTELLDVEYIYNFGNNEAITPKTITTADFGEAYEGMLVSIHGASFFREAGQTIPDEGTSFTITDANGAGTVYFSNDSRLAGETLPNGYLNITGILSQYKDTYQLIPRDKSDIDLLTNAPDLAQPTSFAEIHPNPVSNYLYIKTKRQIKELKLYNLNGQLIRGQTGNRKQLQVADLARGVYVLELRSNNDQISRHKFIRTTE